MNKPNTFYIGRSESDAEILYKLLTLLIDLKVIKIESVPIAGCNNFIIVDMFFEP